MDPEQELQQAQQDVSNYLNGQPVGPKGATGSEAQAIAQAAQAFINSQRARATGETSTDKEARQLDVQKAHQDWQDARDQRKAQSASDLQTQKDTAAGQRSDSRNQTQEDVAATRADATTGAATIRADATTGAAGIRAGATEQAAATRADASTDVAQINAASRIADIQQKAQADLAALDRKFEQNLQTLNTNEALKKDYYAFTNQLQIIRDEHLQQAMEIRQQAVAAQQQEFERPFKEASAAAETKRAETEATRAANEQKYQQASLQVGLAKDQAQQADTAIQSGIKLGVAPPAALVKMQFAPFGMAQQILQNLVSQGQVSPDRVPDGLLPNSTPSAPPSAPAPIVPASPTMVGGMPPGALAGYDAAPKPTMPGGMPPGALAGYDTYSYAPTPAGTT